MSDVALVTDAGDRITLDLDRWRAEPDAAELALLSWLPDPVLDIGCGPGRVTAAIAAAGRPSLGIDPSPVAVHEATRRGAAALRRSVFGPLPGEGRWGSALLLDGNIGIGGDPSALLARVAQLLRRGGHAVVEVDAPGTPTEELLVRIEVSSGAPDGQWFPWARVGADAVASILATTDLVLVGLESGDGRWFAHAVKG